jgi:thiamine biosynthesis lipoprotein
MTYQATRTGVLGTVVELRLDGAPSAVAEAEQQAWSTFERLETVFSTFRADSQLSRWRSGQAECSPELFTVLSRAALWHHRSQGAFHPATAALTARWRQAEREATMPSAGELAELYDQPLPFRIEGDNVARIADCSTVDLNAIAKGYIVDCAASAAASIAGMESVVVNAGGDLRHHGAGSIRVGIEDPFQPFDNAPPRWRVSLSNAALATSGSARRGFRVGEQWLGHVLDPRSGYPVAHTASISVLAASAMDADALATVLGVLPGDQALQFAARYRIGCLLVDASAQVHLSQDWPADLPATTHEC